MNKPTRHLALCLDPVHVGTGGYRLGRVDMSIVRDPATGIPKIPGTSLAGAVRAYAELAKAEDDSLPDINEVFGTAEGDQGKQGMLRFYDAEVVLFPVSSHLGTVWVSTTERLREWLEGVAEGGEQVSVPSGLQDENKVLALKGLDGGKPVHLGWLLLETEAVVGTTAALQLPAHLTFVKRLVLVSDKLFYHLVNDHLEVRTSVAIDDETGAAKGRFLFTYEAIPRGTVIGFEVAIDSRRGGTTTKAQTLQLLRKTFATLKLLGVGGMGTRGFGRIEVLNNAQEAGAAGDTGGGH
jgi:CRISPR-associated protein Cmr4